MSALSYLHSMPRDFQIVEKQWDTFAAGIGDVDPHDFRVVIAKTDLFLKIQPYLKEEDVKTGIPDAGPYVLAGEA